MLDQPRPDDGDPLNLCGRIMLTHALDPNLAEHGLGTSREDARAMIVGAALSATLDTDQSDRLVLLTNILVWLEIACRHDARAMRRALQTPLDALGGVASAEWIGDGVAALRSVRAAIDHVNVPKVRWWRAASERTVEAQVGWR